MKRLQQAILAAISCAALSMLGAGVSAQDLPSSVRYDHSSVRMLAGGSDNGVWNAGVEIDMGPGWKTYWRVPGDAGVPPHFEWKGSDNVARVDIGWPAPKRFYDEAGESIGYKNKVVFPVSVTPSDAGIPVNLKLDLFYAVCNDICIPGSAKLSLTLDGSAGSERDQQLIDEFRHKIPQSIGPITLKSIDVEEYGEDLVLAITTAGVQSPTGADIFVEGSEELHFRKPKLVSDGNGIQAYHLQIDGLKKADGLKGQNLLLTVVDGTTAVARPATID